MGRLSISAGAQRPDLAYYTWASLISTPSACCFRSSANPRWPGESTRPHTPNAITKTFGKATPQVTFYDLGVRPAPLAGYVRELSAGHRAHVPPNTHSLCLSTHQTLKRMVSCRARLHVDQRALRRYFREGHKLGLLNLSWPRLFRAWHRAALATGSTLPCLAGAARAHLTAHVSFTKWS